MKKILIIFFLMVLTASLVFGLVSCNKDDATTYRFVAPEGTPALAMLRLASQKQNIGEAQIEYNVVSPSNIAAEMSSEKGDIIIMPVNAGANLIRQGADYKLVSIAVNGSLFMVGKKTGSNDLTMDDIKGKKIACIGQTGVPGLVFRYVMTQNGIEVISSGNPSSNQVFVQYVADGPAAKQLLANSTVDFAVVGEPAATQFKNAMSLNAEMNMQAEYSKVDASNGNTYPQAGLFVKSSLATNSTFMLDLYSKLKDNKEWINVNAEKVQEEAKTVYESAVFPRASISRCAVIGDELSTNDKEQIVTFLKNVMPKDSQQNLIDWDSVKSRLF